MLNNLNQNYEFISSENQIYDFIEKNENTLEILNAMEPHLMKFFPNNEFSLEICDKLDWTTETKLLINIKVDEEMFFNGMLNNFNEIYAQIEPIIEDIFCPIVLFPEIKNKKFDKINNNSAINLIARTAYFNNDYDGSIEREIRIRDIPKSQQIDEILKYCQTHEDIYAPDIEEELQIDFSDVCEILEELSQQGKIRELM